MTWGWKMGLFISFVILYIGLGIFSWGYDFARGKTTVPSIVDYLTFQKFYDYGKAYEKRAADFFSAETGALKSDAFLSLVLLGIAQLVAVLLLTLLIWMAIPTDKKMYAFLAFGIAVFILSLAMYYRTGDWMLSIFKPFFWLFQGTPMGIDANVVDANVVDANVLDVNALIGDVNL